MVDKEQRKVSRRRFLRGLALAGGGTALAACAPKTVVVKETVVVEGEAKVVEKVVTATPLPKEAVNIIATSQMGIATWDNSLERAKDRFSNINMTVTQTGVARP